MLKVSLSQKTPPAPTQLRPNPPTVFRVSKLLIRRVIQLARAFHFLSERVTSGSVISKFAEQPSLLSQ
jgi:hypothetical protein